MKENILHFPKQSSFDKFPASLNNQRLLITTPKVTEFIPSVTCYETANDSLKQFGIFEGDHLICRTDFSLSEIKPFTICICEINGYQVTRIGAEAEGNIIGIAIGFQRDFGGVE